MNLFEFLVWALSDVLSTVALLALIGLNWLGIWFSITLLQKNNNE